MSIKDKAFDENSYLQNNLDVAKAVKTGVFLSGWDHFQKYGKHEFFITLRKSGYGSQLSRMDLLRSKQNEIISGYLNE